MSLRKATQNLDNLERAMARLGEALTQDCSNSIVIDGTIQRFEFAIELYWKTLKGILEVEGIQTTTPREALQQAYIAGWLNNEHTWLQMLKDRNETSYVYDEDKARKIYVNIGQYYPEMKKTLSVLRKRLAEKG